MSDETIKVHVKGLDKPIEFPASMSPDQIERALREEIEPQLPKLIEQQNQEKLAGFQQEALDTSKDTTINVAGMDVPKAPIEKVASLPGIGTGAKLLLRIAQPDVGRGVADVGQSAKQMYKHATGAEDTAAYDKQLADEMHAYEASRGPNAGFDWGRLGGNVGATSFLGLARAPGLLRYALSSVQGGAGASLAQPVDTTKQDFASGKAIQAGMGAVLAPVAQFGIEKAGSFLANQGRRGADFLKMIARKVTGRSTNPNAAVNPDGTLTQAGAEAAKKLGIDWGQVSDDAKAGLQKIAEDATTVRGMTPEQQLRAALIKEVTGEDATLAQVTRDFADSQTEHSLKAINEVGGPLRQRFARQNQGFLDRMQQLRSGAGGRLADEYDVGRRVAASVKDADKEAQQAVGSLYKQVEVDRGGKFGATPTKLIDALDKASDTEPQLADSVIRRMARMGIKVERTNDPAQAIRFDSFQKPFTASDAENLRKFIGSELDTSTPNKRRLVSSLVKALDSDVFAEHGDDAFGVAREVAKQRFKDLEIPAIKKIVDGDVNAEDIFDKFVRRGGIDDLKALKDYMSRRTEQTMSATGDKVVRDPHLLGQAWDEMRSHAFGELLRKATPRAEVDELGNQLFSGAALKKEMERLGRRKLEVLFSPEELKRLDSITKVAEWRMPLAETLNTSRTSADFWNMIERILAYLPGKSGMVLRGAGRAARIGGQELANEAAAKAAMVPGETLAKQGEQAASAATRETVKNVTGAARAPTFFSIAGERKKVRQ